MAVGSADWSIAIGFLIFIIACIFAIYYYLKYKKVFLIAYVGSVSVYLFSIFYTWDVFDLGETYVLILLLVSTGLMFYLAKYFKDIKLNPDKVHTSLKEKTAQKSSKKK